MIAMDETNLQLLHLLQRDARMGAAEMAKAVGRPERAVRERLRALEHEGVVQGYEVRIDWDRVGLPAHAVLRAQCDMGRVPELARHLAAIPNVTQALLLTGSKAVFASLRVRDLAHLERLLKQHFVTRDLKRAEVEIALHSLVDLRPPSALGAATGGAGPTP